ncbi:MAG: TIGR02587 family membrane protein [Geminicoccaceae bacterium]
MASRTRTNPTAAQGRPFADRHLLVALARAAAGAMLFGLPLFMTMEMWRLGFTIEPARLALYVVVSLPLLAGLAYIAGFRDDTDWFDAAVDGLVAWLVGALTGAAVLALLGALTPEMSLAELAGKIAVVAVPAGVGAALARSQLGEREEEQEEKAPRESYGGELFLMAAGAVFFAFNLAPTDEIPLIAHQQRSPWVAVALVALSLLALHGFVYGAGFRGQHAPRPGRSLRADLLGLTLPGYVIVLVACTYVLWTFGRLDGLAPGAMLHVVLVLGLPASIGAAAARLIL